MKKLLPSYIRVPLILFTLFGLIEYFVDSGNQPAFLKYPIISVFLIVILFVIIALEIVVAAVDNILYQIKTEEQKKIADLEANIKIKDTVWFKKLMKVLTKAEPIENQSILLNHDYDGIKELDNSLPPWWVYFFYLCILFGVVYLVRFELMGGDTQEMELQKEMIQAKIDIEEYQKTAPDLMDEKTVVLLTEPPLLEEGKEIFLTNCVACHRPDAGGAIGPNLTDEHWVLGGGIKNVFHTIANGGRDGKGMISWKGILKPKQMQKVASYILSLKGSNPKEPKAPEGEIWIEEGAKKQPAVDSTKAK